MIRLKKKLFLLSTILFLIDYAIKLLIAYLIPFQKEVIVVKDFFYITYVKNLGAAWSILNGYRFLLITIGILALIIFYKLFLKNKEINNIQVVIYSLLIGGVLGNLFDRIYYGYVIDYLKFIIFRYHFPIFNFADIILVISVILISYQLLKEGELNE